MAGTSAVIGTVANGSLTTEKYANESVTSDKRTHLGEVAHIIPTKWGQLPNYDEETQIFTLYVDTILIYRNKHKILTQTTDIDVSVETNQSVKITYNPNSETFNVYNYGIIIPENEVLITSFRRRLPGASADSYYTSLAISCPYTINGKLYGKLLDDGVYTGGKIAHITPNKYGELPNYDEENQLFTLYDDTIIIYNDKHKVINGKNDIDISSITSAVVKITYNDDNDTFKVYNYSAVIPQNEVLITSFRRRLPGADVDTYYTALSISCPYTVNGKLYGKLLSESLEYNQPVVVTNDLDANVKAIAHRGYSEEAPENTLPAFKLAKNKGFSYVECDVRWSSDDIPVLLHDISIDRTSDGTGYVDQLTLDELKSYDYGSWKSGAYIGTTIPTFEEFIIECKKLNLHPYIELKSGFDVAKGENLVNIVKKHRMENKCTWISKISNLNEIKNLSPNARLGFLTDTLDTVNIDSIVNLKTQDNEVFINVAYASLDVEKINEAHQKGIDVETWTLNTESTVLSAVDKGVDGITTDHLNIAKILQT